MRSNFSLYALSEKGSAYNTFVFAQNGKLMRLTSFSTSVDFSLSELLSGNKGKSKTAKTSNPGQDLFNNGFDTRSGMQQNQGGQENTSPVLMDEYGYQQFDVPWTMDVGYGFEYSKPGLKPNITQAVTMRGNVTLTKMMAIIYTSGYDFKGKAMTMTTIGIKRDLHCWEMNLNWIPVGTMKGWNFTIRAKASVLGDLKYERRKDYHDSF